jgi:hypothetical protein
MAQTCPTGWKWSEANNRCIKVRTKTPTVSAPNTGAGFTSGGIPIIDKNNADLASELYGAGSGAPQDGVVSGVEKLQKQQYMDSGGSVGTGTTSVNQFAQNQLDSLPKATTAQDYSYISAATPRMGETEDPKDYQVRVANWEKEQALKQANAIAKETVGIRGAFESQQNKGREDLFKREGSKSALGAIGGLGTKMNPEYVAMTTEEKRMNAGLPPEQQIKERIEMTEADLTPEQKAARAKGLNVRFTTEQRENKMDSTKKTSFIDPTTGKTMIGGAAEQLFKVKEFLGAETGDRLDIDADGKYFLRDEAGIEVDPIKRAEAKVQEDADKAKKALAEQNRIETDRIKNQNRTPDGGITEQGIAELQKWQTKYNDRETELNEQIDTALEDSIKYEKNRQIEVDTQITALNAGAAEKSFAELVSNAKVSRLNELKAGGMNDMVALAQVEREYAAMKDDPKAFDLANYLGGLETGGTPIEQQFAKVYDQSGKNIDKTFTAFSARYGEFAAKQLQNTFLKEKGWDEASIESKNVMDEQKNILAGGGDEMATETAALLMKYGKIDPTGLLQKEFAMNVVGSPDTNFREKTIAQMALDRIASEERKLMPEYTITKDRFGNNIAIDPITLKERSINGASGGATYQPTVDPGIDAMAQSVIDGDRTPADVKNLMGEQVAEQVGARVAQKLAEANVGQKYSKKQREKGAEFGGIYDILADIKSDITDEESGFSGAVGAGFQKIIPFRDDFIEGTKAYDFSKKVEQLSNALAAPNLEKLKGAMSDKDIMFIKNIATKLSTGLTEEAFKKEVDKLDKIIEKTAKDLKFDIADFSIEMPDEFEQWAKDEYGDDWRAFDSPENRKTWESLQEKETTPSTGFRTDRHNNPTALMWTPGVEKFFKGKGYDVKKGDVFPNGKNYTLDMTNVSDPVGATIEYIDAYSLTDPYGGSRWSYTQQKGITDEVWKKLTEEQKRQLIQVMYSVEKGAGSPNFKFA